MSLLRNKLKERFSQVPNEVITDNRLKDGAKVLMFYLFSKPNDWIVRNKDIQNSLDIRQASTLAGYWKELIDAGWITRTRRIDENGKLIGGFDYVLNDEPILVENHNMDNSNNGKTNTLNNTDNITNTDITNKKSKPKKENKSSNLKPLKDLDYNSAEYSNRFNKAEYKRRLIEAGADEIHVNDLIRNRKGKSFTISVFNRFVKEAERYGVPISQAVQITAESGWQTFHGQYSGYQLVPQRNIIYELEVNETRFKEFFNSGMELKRLYVNGTREEKIKFANELNKHFINDNNKRYNHTYSKALEFALEYVKYN